MLDDDDLSMHDEDCPCCSGDEACPNCGGSGLEYDTDYGRDRIACDTCAGTGNCPECIR